MPPHQLTRVNDSSQEFHSSLSDMILAKLYKRSKRVRLESETKLFKCKKYCRHRLKYLQVVFKKLQVTAMCGFWKFNHLRNFGILVQGFSFRAILIFLTGIFDKKETQ